MLNQEQQDQLVKFPLAAHELGFQDTRSLANDLINRTHLPPLTVIVRNGRRYVTRSSLNRRIRGEINQRPHRRTFAEIERPYLDSPD